MRIIFNSSSNNETPRSWRTIICTFEECTTCCCSMSPPGHRQVGALLGLSKNTDEQRRPIKHTLLTLYSWNAFVWTFEIFAAIKPLYGNEVLRDTVTQWLYGKSINFQLWWGVGEYMHFFKVGIQGFADMETIIKNNDACSEAVVNFWQIIKSITRIT